MYMNMEHWIAIHYFVKMYHPNDVPTCIKEKNYIIKTIIRPQSDSSSKTVESWIFDISFCVQMLIIPTREKLKYQWYQR